MRIATIGLSVVFFFIMQMTQDLAVPNHPSQEKTEPGKMLETGSRSHKADSDA
jgi:hypothetical protein